MFGKAMLLALVLSTTALAGTATADRWLHVRVDEGGRHGERVRIQIPLNMVRAVLPLVDTDELRDGKLWIGDEDLDARDLRAILEAVRDAEDGEYVRVDSDDASARVAKRGAYVQIRVEERDAWDDDDEVVKVKIPMAVVEALITGDEEELDLIAAIDALDGLGKIMLVSVHDGDATVRVWIDERYEELEGNGANDL